MNENDSKSEIILYQTEDGTTRVEVRLQDETVWLTVAQIAELFQRDRTSIFKHIQNIFEEAELSPEQTVANFATVQTEGKREVLREIDHFNLDVIISVGYRVKSHRGTQFRIWATQRLREYIIKGFTLDDDRLKQRGGGNYFDELLNRIRDIRSSERAFWQKVLDIYATSIDYDPRVDTSQRFFATIQNKMHWAAHGQTAAEVIFRRADGTKPNMGLSTWRGPRPRKEDVGVAKTYLREDELRALNLIVSAYLDFAELQALSRRTMYMLDWIRKLDDFLKLTDREILTHAGKVSHDQALDRAAEEFKKYRASTANDPTAVDRDFVAAVDELKKVASHSAKASQPSSKTKSPIKQKPPK
jgi:hypothetical protein